MKDKISIRKAIAVASIVNIVQIAALAVMLVYRYFERPYGAKNNTGVVNMLLFFIVTAVLLNCFFIFRYAGLITLSGRNFDMLNETNVQLEKLNHTLKSQRHDFMNHLQVVYSLMEMDEFEDAKAYIESVYSDIQKVNKALKTSSPAVNALIQAKLIHAEKLGIQLEVSITTQLTQLAMPPWELCRILGNIIDNSIYALVEIDYDRRLSIELFENLKMYGFTISNNGPAIPEGIIERIFDSGFTTKGDNGGGMGLAISRELLHNYGGSIIVSSGVGETKFSGCFPKKVSTE